MRKTWIIFTMIAVVESMHMVMIHLILSMRTEVILKEAMKQNSQERILPRDHMNKTV